MPRCRRSPIQRWKRNLPPSTVTAGTASNLTLTIVNVNTVERKDFFLTDVFPTGMVIAGAASTTCGDGVLSAAVGSDTLGITGADVAANGSCTITVPVKAMKEGSYTNGSSNITAINYIDKSETTDTLEVEPAPPSSLQGIPTLGEWALILLSMCMAGLGFYRLRRANI